MLCLRQHCCRHSRQTVVHSLPAQIFEIVTSAEPWSMLQCAGRGQKQVAAMMSIQTAALVRVARPCTELESRTNSHPQWMFRRVYPLQGAGRKQVAAVMGIQTARSCTVARPFMRLKPQHIAVQVPLNPLDAEASLNTQQQSWIVSVMTRFKGPCG